MLSCACRGTRGSRLRRGPFGSFALPNARRRASAIAPPELLAAVLARRRPGLGRRRARACDVPRRAIRRGARPRLSSSRIVSAMRLRAGSTSRTLTRTTSPGFTTCAGPSRTRCQRRDVHQPVLVHADVHEGPESGDVGHRALEHHAGLQVAIFSTPSWNVAVSNRARVAARLLQLRQDVRHGGQPEALVREASVERLRAGQLPTGPISPWPRSGSGAPPRRPPGARPTRPGDRPRRDAQEARAQLVGLGPKPRHLLRSCAGRKAPSGRGGPRFLEPRLAEARTRVSSGGEAVFTSTPTAFTQSSTTRVEERDSFCR